MNKKNVALEKEKPIINSLGLIDNIVQARNNAFTLERSKDLDLAILKTQSEYFSDEENKNHILQYLTELENKRDTLKKHGTLYLNNLDSAISTAFKNVPVSLEEVSEILKDIEKFLPEIINNTAEDISSAIQELDRIKNETSKNISELLELIIIFCQELTNKINLACNILECCKKDKDQKEEREKPAAQKEDNQDNSYKKNYLKYQESIDILETGNTALKNVQTGVQGISNNLKIIKKYYESIQPIDGSININDFDDLTIQKALRNIRKLNSRIENHLPEIKEFTMQL